MTRHLSVIAALVFYPLGLSAFLAFLCLRNEMFIPWPAFWLRVVDLPLVGAGLLLGAIALHRSLADGASSRGLGWFIGCTAGALFVVLIILNFWPLFSPLFASLPLHAHS